MQSFTLAIAIFSDTDSLLKENAPILRFCLEYIVDAILTYYAYSTETDSGISKEVAYVFEAAAAMIYVKLTFTCTKYLALNINFFEVNRYIAVVLKTNQHFRNTGGTPCVAALEYYICKLVAANISDILLTKHPTDCISYIRFAAAVGSYYSGNTAAKVYFDLISEGFKAVHLQPVKLQMEFTSVIDLSANEDLTKSTNLL